MPHSKQTLKLFEQFESELEKISHQDEKDYTQASEILNNLYRILIESPNNKIINKLNELLCSKYKIEVLAINFPLAPLKSPSIDMSEIYKQDFDIVSNFEENLVLKTTDNKEIKIDLEKLKQDKFYLHELINSHSFTSDSLHKLENLKNIGELDKKLDFILNFDIDDLYLFKNMNEQIEIAKMKKKLFAHKGLTIDLTSPDLIKLNPKMAAMITRLTTLCHWGSRGPERVIFSHSKDNVEQLCQALKSEKQFQNLKRLTILGCATTSREIPEKTAALYAFNGELKKAVIDKLNNEVNSEEPNYLLNFFVDDKYKRIEIRLLKLPLDDKKSVLLNINIDGRLFYQQFYNSLPTKAKQQAPKPDSDINKLMGYVKNALNNVSKKNELIAATVSPKNMNFVLEALGLRQVHKIIYQDCGLKKINNEINLHTFSKKQKSAIYQNAILKENNQLAIDYQEGKLSKDERKSFRRLFPAMGKTNVTLQDKNIVDSDTLDLALLAESTINSQRIHSPIEVKGYTIPVTKAKSGDYIVAIGDKKKIAQILEENIPKSITYKRK